MRAAKEGKTRLMLGVNEGEEIIIAPGTPNEVVVTLMRKGSKALLAFEAAPAVVIHRRSTLEHDKDVSHIHVSGR